MNCEILFNGPMSPKGARMLDAMSNAGAAAGVAVKVSTHYKGHCDLLMLYGLGEQERAQAFAKHRASNRHAVVWDLGYYGRPGPKDNYPMRMSIDAPHPQALIRAEPSDRWDSAGIPLREDALTHGHIVLVGLGAKARTVIKARGPSWEREKLRHIRNAYPGRQIIYRPKRGTSEAIDCETAAAGPIESVLFGASLVVCKHSNVAIDACIAGVPVACEDGAARALYDDNVTFPLKPTRAQRLNFLRGLAWFQWTPAEALPCWLYLRERLSGLT